MSIQWERKNPIIKVNTKLASILAKPYLKTNNTLAISVMNNGKLNTNYKLRSEYDNRECLLRIHSSSADVLLKEYIISKRVKNRISVPKFYYVNVDDNNPLHKPYALIEWINGKHITFSELPSLEIIEILGAKLGETLANLRKFEFDKSGFFDRNLNVSKIIIDEKENYLSFIKERIFSNIGCEILGKSIRDRVWNFVNTYYMELDTQEKKNFLVHGDFNFSNMLFLKDKKQNIKIVLLDWEFAFSGSQLFDLGNLFRYDEKLPNNFKYHFINGYLMAGGYLPKNWYLIIKLLDLLSLCDLLIRDKNSKNLILDVKNRIVRTLSFKRILNDGR